jgi:DNA processing protein
MTAGAQPSRETQLDWLRLARAEGVGPASFTHLMRRHGSAERALQSLPAAPTREAAARELDAGLAGGARLLLADDPRFPPTLAAIDGAPPVLWILGDLEILGRPSIAIVGARSASAAGRRFARELAAGLGEAGLVVVSGLARGIDAATHAGALATGTVAVLAGGVDQPYPEENQGLWRDIQRRGAVVSERPPGHTARAADFPRRNRIISGLSLGVVVVEAELRSGSLITARLAGEQGREVFAVPGSPMDPRARGCNDLIRQGAVLVESAQDVLEGLPAFAVDPSPKPARRPSSAAARGVEAEGEDLVERLAVLLSPTPVSIDELVRATGAPAPALLAAITELEVLGRAALLHGGLVSRA